MKNEGLENLVKRMIKIVGFISMLSLVTCTGIPSGLQPVKGFEPKRYLGKWYEIARLDHSFERNLSNVSAQYSKRTDGGIEVINRGFNGKSGKWKDITGRAYFLEDETVGSLKVSFFGPFYGGYHIIALDDEEYKYSMVTGPSRSYLWILSREKTIEDKVLNDLIAQAREWGFDTGKLIYVEHNLP